MQFIRVVNNYLILMSHVKNQDNSNCKSAIQTAPSSLFHSAFLKKKQSIMHFYSFDITHNLFTCAFTYYSLRNLTLREIMLTIDIGPCQCQRILSFHSAFSASCNYHRSCARCSIFKLRHICLLTLNAFCKKRWSGRGCS